MPRETISTPVGPYHVKVGWARDRDVQVGVEAEDERSLFWLLLGSHLAELGDQFRRIGLVEHEDDEALGRAVLNTIDMMTPLYRGVWSDLDREGCNDLIRVVRRARDQAYGRDE